MNVHEIIGYPLFFVAALECILGLILLKHNPHRSPINRAVAVFSFFASAFSLLTAIMYIRASFGLDFLLAAKATWIGWFCIPPALQFIFYLKDATGRAARRVALVLYPFMTVILLVSVSTDWIVAAPYTLIPYVYHAGPFDGTARTIDGALLLWLIVEIYLLRKKVTGSRKAQLNYFFYGTLIFAGGGLLISAFLQVFAGYRFDPTLSSYFSFPWLLLTFYAITRYRLFDIPLILSRVLSTALLLTVAVGIDIVLFELLAPALGTALGNLAAVLITGLIFFTTPFAAKTQDWIRSIVLRGRYDYQKILKESSQAIITILDLDVLLNYIIDSIKKSFAVDSICLFLKEDDEQYTARHGTIVADQPVLDQTIVQWVNAHRQVIVREGFDEGLSGQGREKVQAAMAKINAEIVVPLISKGKLQGVLALGNKGSRKPYVQSDMDLVQALAHHAAIAIENARLYDEARRVTESLLESEQKFRTLAHTIQAGIVIHREGRFLYMNPAVEAITGYNAEEFMKLDFTRIIHPDSLGLVQSRAAARLAGRAVPGQYEFKIITKNGEERWVLSASALIEYGREPALIAALIDITVQKQIEEERTRLFEEGLRHYQEKISEEKRHQQEKEKILMDIHDGIGGIITNINLLTEVAKKASSPSDLNQLLSTISGLSRNGLSEIRTLMRSLESKDLTWQTFIGELKNQGMSTITPHNIGFEMTTQIEEDDEPPRIVLYLNLFRIYREALTNVLKHSKAGKVTVDLRMCKGRLILSVRDNGRGWTDTAKIGKGRGLTNMKVRAAEIGGTVEITADKGTCVRVDIPLSAVPV